ncbi:putative damage-inducible protein DinB [Anoxybacillus vitaminiphilus]|uniref:Putative damage-inducible protein DinB n=1 Tax=Paranoxybacillus vitaminiphilus TaxID=581036 RepID=A0A327XYB1_9BACL|nr:DinB family protein [Anoxybacillus vitaminiphilus]RAK13968.1 putative damage-inducible protein DinB [Anoxybacillus vitaminiphilus]
MKKLTLQFFDYHSWATKQLIEHLSKLPKEIMNKEVNSVFPSISQTFAHMYAVDELWFLRISGKSVNSIEPKPFKTIQEINDAFTYLHNEMLQFLNFKDDLEQTVIYTNTKGQRFSNSIREMIYHIVNHGTYHRGNISAMIRQLGYQGVSTDYIYYLRNINKA